MFEIYLMNPGNGILELVFINAYKLVRFYNSRKLILIGE